MIKDTSMIGKRIRVYELVGENDFINDRYAGREGEIALIDDMGQYHIIWDGTNKIGGLAINPQEDDFEILDDFDDELDDEMTLEGFRPINHRRNRYHSLNESFENKKLSEEIAKHGGLDNKTFLKKYDARYELTDYDLSRVSYKSYLSKEELDTIKRMIDSYKPLVSQILYCADGGAIIIDDYNPDNTNIDYNVKKNISYKNKLSDRNYNFQKSLDKNDWRQYLSKDDNYLTKYRRKNMKGDTYHYK